MCSIAFMQHALHSLLFQLKPPTCSVVSSQGWHTTCLFCTYFVEFVLLTTHPLLLLVLTVVFRKSPCPSSSPFVLLLTWLFLLFLCVCLKSAFCSTANPYYSIFMFSSHCPFLLFFLPSLVTLEAVVVDLFV